jgi:hypothetical protein
MSASATMTAVMEPAWVFRVEVGEVVKDGARDARRRQRQYVHSEACEKRKSLGSGRRAGSSVARPADWTLPEECASGSFFHVM